MRRASIGLVLALLGAALPGTRFVEAQAPAAALTAPPFQGPSYGTAGGHTALGTDFSYTCNVKATATAVKAAGAQIAVGAGIASSTCGLAYLYVSAPGSGHFQASLAVDDAATVAAPATPMLRIFVLGRGGYVLHTMDASASKGTVKPIDVDVAGAETLAIGFPNAAQSYLFNMQLTGTAQVRRPTPLSGTGAPAGAAVVTAGQETLTCNARLTTEVKSVSRVVIPVGGAIEMTGCGSVTVKVPAGSRGTFAMRFGASDVSPDFTSVPIVVQVRVLDASGLLLRKSIGLAYQGGGLQPIWVNVTGGSTVTLTSDTSIGYYELVGLSFLPGQYKQHPNPDHQQFGSPGGGPVNIVPESFADSCNAHPGTADITVNHVQVVRDTYLLGTDCGVASLIMTNATGHFHALVGMDDATLGGKTATVKLTVLDPNSHPLFTTTVKNAIGRPGVPLEADITGASIVKLEFSGYPIVYELRMTGQATLYDRVFPPSEPPTVIPGGVAVNPRAFALACNALITKEDVVMIHAAALEQWTLDGQGCGSATLDLTKTAYPHHTFGGEFGLAASDQRYKLGHVRVSVLGADGKVLRTLVLTAREGYGPRPFQVSLAGGAKLQLTWGDQIVKVFGMTLA